MTSSRSAAPLDIRLRPSRLLSAYLLILAGLLLFSLTQLPLPTWSRLTLGLCCLGLIRIYWQRHIAMTGPAAVQGLRHDDGAWEVLTASGYQVASCRAATVWPWLVALDMRVGRRRFPMLVLPDAVTSDELRRLRQRVLLSR